MASVKGFQIKNVKRTIGHEGFGYTGTMYLDGKKVGTYEDYGDGAMPYIKYISKDAEMTMTKRIIEYAKENKNDYVINLYKQRPQQYKEEVERFKRLYPYIPDSDINIQTMASNNIVYISSDFLDLYEAEKFYKRVVKKGFGSVGIKGNEYISFPKSWSKEKIMEHKCERYFFSLEDFNV